MPFVKGQRRREQPKSSLKGHKHTKKRAQSSFKSGLQTIFQDKTSAEKTLPICCWDSLRRNRVPGEGSTFSLYPAWCGRLAVQQTKIQSNFCPLSISLCKPSPPAVAQQNNPAHQALLVGRFTTLFPGKQEDSLSLGSEAGILRSWHGKVYKPHCLVSEVHWFFPSEEGFFVVACSRASAVPSRGTFEWLRLGKKPV